MPSIDGWAGFFAKQGVFALLFAALLVFLGYYVFIPMQEQSKEFQQAIIKSNDKHAESAAVTAKAISGLDESSRQTLRVLEQLRDDQRRGVWNEARPKGGE